jgi:hypothetical protein
MPRRSDVVADQLNALAEDLESLWRAATRDPGKEARRERAWGMLMAGVGVAATMVTRRVLAKLWPILTGEQPPTPRPPQATAAP